MGRMPVDAQAILDSLELIAERGVDPAPLVYARLFERHPGAEALFVLGPSAKGHMLDEAFRAILDHLGPRTWSASFLRTTRDNHEDLGVAGETYADLFPAIAGALRELAGEAWSPAMEAAWGELCDELRLLSA